MRTKVSTKYQIVIPKEIRESEKEIKPGAVINITLVDSGEIRISIPKSGESCAERVKGHAKEIYPNDANYIPGLRKKWGQRKLPT